MGQTTDFLNALKSTLRAKNITYAQVAKHLDLSEASVKRLFSEQSFSLQRLEQVCAMAGVEITDLAEMIKARKPFVTELTEDQEKQLANEPKLLLVALLVVNNWQFQEILKFHTFSEPELIQMLAKLDRLKLLELLPNNRIRSLTARQFRWRKFGPIQRFFQEHVQQEVFGSVYGSSNEALVFLNGMLSKESFARIQGDINRLARTFDDLTAEDSGLPLEQRFGYNFIMAIRPWGLPVFDGYRRK